MRRALLLLPLAFLLTGCKAESPEEMAAADPTSTAGIPEQPLPGPVTTPAVSPESAGIAYDLPEGWNRVAPASTMRIDQATIPGPGGSAEMGVFFFGAGSGGDVRANLDRWASQVESDAPPVEETFETAGLRVTWMDVSGTLEPSTKGMGPSTPQPNSRMFAAVVEGEGGPWFFKVTGPEETMAAERDAFVAMLRSVRKPTEAS